PKRGFLVLRRGAQPFESLRRRQIAPLERRLDFLATGKQRRRRVAERAIAFAADDLVQVLVVNPDAVAVADQQLLVGFLHGPAKSSEPRDRKLTSGLRNLASYRVDDHHHIARLHRWRLALDN